MTPESCSGLAREEPLPGTAPYARAWLVLEHPGPWGRDALTDSGLPDRLVEHIARAQLEAPFRFLAARRIGEDRRHAPASTARPFPRRVWLASCDAHDPITRTTRIAEVEEILDWDLVALGEGVVPAIGQRVEQPLEFVCTHSKRDACCAIWGRERVASVPADRREQVWECSHLGGHRFAATSLFLPSGRLYGRLREYHEYPRNSDEGIVEPNPMHLRGPSYLTAPLQAAECLVRQHASVTYAQPLDVIDLESKHDRVIAKVQDATERSWLVHCQIESFTSPASCGGRPEERVTWHARFTDDHHG